MHLEAALKLGVEASVEAVWLADEALRASPQSAQLWFLRGRLIEMAQETCLHSHLDAIASFVRCIEINPGSADTYEYLGQYYDGNRVGPTRTMDYYREGARL